MRSISRRRASAGFPLVALLLSVAAAAVPPRADAAAVRPGGQPPTVRVVRVDPVDAHGQLRRAWKVKYRFGDASCATPSSETGVTYLCSSAASRDGVYDPCWLEGAGPFVVCQPHPWEHVLTRLRVNGGFDDSGGLHALSWPWGLRVGPNHRQCLYSPADVRYPGGHEVHYQCRHDVVLAGPIRKHGHRWSVRAYRQANPDSTSFAAMGRLYVTVAWFAKPSRIYSTVTAG